jgi:mitofusin
MDMLYEKAQKLKQDKTEAKKNIYEKLNYTEQKLLLLTQQMKEKIQQMVSETEEKVNELIYSHSTHLRRIVL